jgi:hypothetical protein
MARPRKTSIASETSNPDSTQVRFAPTSTLQQNLHFLIPLANSIHQELGSMYDYLAKIILLGPSGAGKSVSYPITSPPRL